MTLQCGSITPAAMPLSGHSWWNKKPRSRRAAAHGGVEATDQGMLAGYLVMLAGSGGGPSLAPPSSAKSNPAATDNNHEQRKTLTPAADDDANWYKCSVCGEVFRCYQALGGHKTKHRPKQPPTAVSASATDDLSGASTSGRVHECSICHESFRSGQALGGHKRKHYEGEIRGSKSRRSSSDGVGFSDGGGESYSDGGGHQEPRLCGTLDLNFPPPPEGPLGLSLTLKL